MKVVDCKEDHDTIIKAFSNQRRSIAVLVNQGGRSVGEEPSGLRSN